MSVAACFSMYNASVIIEYFNSNIILSVSSFFTCDRLNLSHERRYLKFSLGGDPVVTLNLTLHRLLRDSFTACVEVCKLIGNCGYPP